MANPRENPTYDTSIGKVNTSFAFTAGTSGALPTAASSYRGDISQINFAKAVKPTGTGLYDFFLNEPWLTLVNWNIKVIQASFATTGACVGEVTVDNVSTARPNSKVRITFYDASMAAVDLATGDIVRVTLNLQYKKGT